MRLLTLLAAGLASGSALAQPLPDAVAAEVKERETYCTGQGAKAAIGPKFLRRLDLDGDGLPDFVLDDAEARCPVGVPGWCGSGGCTVTVLLATREGDAKEVVRQVAASHSLRTRGANSELTIVQKGGPPMVFRFADGCAYRTDEERDGGKKRSC